MPLLKKENPRLALSLSETALRLRQDDTFLEENALERETNDVFMLRAMPQALRSRVLGNLLRKWGIREPEHRHIAMAEALVFADNPSARACLPGNITLERCYGILRKVPRQEVSEAAVVNCPGVTELPQWNLRIICRQTESGLRPHGTVVVRSRQSGDEIRLPGGKKSLKKLFIDRKIPVSQRPWVPVLADEGGVLAVHGLGVNLDRVENPGMHFLFEEI
jgi:tRNA(Ile)-lysidine synthase